MARFRIRSFCRASILSRRRGKLAVLYSLAFRASSGRSGHAVVCGRYLCMPTALVGWRASCLVTSSSNRRSTKIYIALEQIHTKTPTPPRTRGTQLLQLRLAAFICPASHSCGLARPKTSDASTHGGRAEQQIEPSVLHICIFGPESAGPVSTKALPPARWGFEPHDLATGTYSAPQMLRSRS